MSEHTRAGRAAMLEAITPVLLTFNEEANIGRTLSRLTWGKDIVIVDSGSTDQTLAIASQFPQVRVSHRAFDSHARQWQFATGQTDIRTPWILRLDADYDLSEELIAEVSLLDADAPVSAYRIAFDYAIYGRKLRSSLYPPNTVLLRTGRFSIQDGGHTERWTIDGRIENLSGRITHDDRKPLSHWLASQQRYAKKEVDYLMTMPRENVSRAGRLRLMGWAAPLLVFFYVLFVKRCVLDGWPGWFYALQRLMAETMIALEVVDRRVRRTS